MDVVTKALIKVIVEAWTNPFTTKSDFARYFANEVALCGCENLITTRDHEGTYTTTWRVTPRGLAALNNTTLNGEIPDAD